MLCNKQDPDLGKMTLHSDHDHVLAESKELTLLNVDERDENEMITMSNARRNSLQMNHDKYLLLALAWVRLEDCTCNIYTLK